MSGAATDSQRKRARPHCHPTTAARFRTARLTIGLIAPQDRNAAHAPHDPKAGNTETHAPLQSRQPDQQATLRQARHAPCHSRGATTGPAAPPTRRPRTPDRPDARSHPTTIARRQGRTSEPENQATVHKAPTPGRTRELPTEHDCGPASHPHRHVSLPHQIKTSLTHTDSADTSASSRDTRRPHDAPDRKPAQSHTQNQGFPIAMPLTSSAPKDTPGGGQHRQP